MIVSGFMKVFKSAWVNEQQSTSRASKIIDGGCPLTGFKHGDFEVSDCPCALVLDKQLKAEVATLLGN